MISASTFYSCHCPGWGLTLVAVRIAGRWMRIGWRCYKGLRGYVHFYLYWLGKLVADRGGEFVGVLGGGWVVDGFWFEWMRMLKGEYHDDNDHHHCVAAVIQFEHM